MLNGLLKGRAVAAAGMALAAGAAAAAPGVARADVGSCGRYICLSTTAPGENAPSAPARATGAGAGAPAPCSYGGRTYACQVPGLGSFNRSDGCYYELASPQPPAGDIAWQGHQPGDGAVYTRTCTLGSSIGQGQFWLASAPPGSGGGAGPAQLARQAVARMLLTGPRIGIAPPPGTSTLVGLPVWLWTAVTPTTWGPKSASASAGGTTVTATARVAQIAWAMGDGTTVVCTTPGEPYQPRYGTQTPPCGHTYATTSAARPGGRFPITATSTWTVTWRAPGGQSGTFSTTRQSMASVVVGESQTLNGN